MSVGALYDCSIFERKKNIIEGKKIGIEEFKHNFWARIMYALILFFLFPFRCDHRHAKTWWDSVLPLSFYISLTYSFTHSLIRAGLTARILMRSNGDRIFRFLSPSWNDDDFYPMIVYTDAKSLM